MDPPPFSNRKPHTPETLLTVTQQKATLPMASLSLLGLVLPSAAGGRGGLPMMLVLQLLQLTNLATRRRHSPKSFVNVAFSLSVALSFFPRAKVLNLHDASLPALPEPQTQTNAFVKCAFSQVLQEQEDLKRAVSEKDWPGRCLNVMGPWTQWSGFGL